MIFNPEMTREAICGLEVTPQQLAEIDKEMEEDEVEESASPTLDSPSPRNPAKKKRSRFAIEAPEKILEEALRKEEEDQVYNVRPSRKTRSAGRRKSRGKYKKT